VQSEYLWTMKTHLTIVLLTLTLTLFCQSASIEIKSKTDSKKKKILKFDRIYEIGTRDTVYYSQIVGSNDSCLKLGIVKITIDSVKTVKRLLKGSEKIYHSTQHIDTICISFSRINYLKKDLLKDRKWLDPISWTLIGGGVGGLTVQLSTLGKDSDIKVWMGVVSGLCIITFPILFIGTRTIKYDMRNTWTF